ncbi:MAG TPA: hypothetical protein VM925_18800 [Labilithrix sp.]|nr:hypothetical protein [Labilithrix sp.]
MALENRSSVEAHVAECDECRVLVSAIRRASFIDPSELGPPPEASAASQAEPVSTSAVLAASPVAVDARVKVVDNVSADGIGAVRARVTSPVRRIALVAAATIGGLVLAGIVLNTVVAQRDSVSSTVTTSGPGAAAAAASGPAIVQKRD